MAEEPAAEEAEEVATTAAIWATFPEIARPQGRSVVAEAAALADQAEAAEVVTTAATWAIYLESARPPEKTEAVKIAVADSVITVINPATYLATVPRQRKSAVSRT